MNVVTRFAPSPTGYFHVGSYRTALFSWIYARQNKGKFILRIEDTDRERSKKEYEENITESLGWLGLSYDDFHRQSERKDIYKKYIQGLIASGYAYTSEEESLGEKKESAADNPTRISGEVIRFNNPNKKVVFNDLVRGEIRFDTTELGDFVIARREDDPIFHLVNVIDDYEMGVTHIIRGEDHISNTARHILIYEAIGAAVPAFAHIPLLLAPDRSKLSKRNGAVPVTEYRNRGFLPEAIINYLALLGWHPADNRELLTLDEIVRDFSLDRVQKSGAIFDEDKLKWFNRHYVLQLSDSDFIERAKPFMPEWLSSNSELFRRLLPALREKTHIFSDITHLFGKDGEMAFVKESRHHDRDLLLWKKQPDAKAAMEHLRFVQKVLSELPEKDFDPEHIRAAVWAYADKHGKGNVLWPFRAALTGQEKSPDPFVCAYILGKRESLARISKAIATLEK